MVEHWYFWLYTGSGIVHKKQYLFGGDHMDREYIIKKARPLFYEYGIKDVSLKQIAEECDTTVSLITYYFGSKADIAQAVYMQFFYELEKLIENKYYENKISYDFRSSGIMYVMSTIHLYEYDPKARRFFLEYCNMGMDYVFFDGYDDIYKNLDKKVFFTKNTTDKLILIAASAHSASMGLMYAYFSGKIDCTYNQFVDYALRKRCTILSMSDKETKQLIRVTKKLYAMFNYKIKPDFTLE